MFRPLRLLLLLPGLVFGGLPLLEMTETLEVANWWEAKANDRLGIGYNNLLETGYWAMPSARMDKSGVLGVGFTTAYPYRIYNARAQLYERFELTGAYRIFQGFEDPALGHHGFGEFSDKGINLKWALLLPEDSDFMFPGLAVGTEDFLGSCRFLDRYIVATQVIRSADLELTLGWGEKRIKGFFGGATWSPLRHLRWSGLRGLTVAAEIDATDYKNDPHWTGPGRRVESRFNYGLQYHFDEIVHLSVSRQKGWIWSGSAALTYDFGKEEGAIPKFTSVMPYTSPVNIEPVGCLRTPQILVHDIGFALQQQGFALRGAWMDGSELYLQVINGRYRQFKEARRRLDYLLSSLIPANIDKVHVLFEWNGMLTQELTYHTIALRQLRQKQIGRYELEIVTPQQDPIPAPEEATTLFRAHRPYWMVRAEPFMENFFGSASGKFKYILGLSASFSGWLPGEMVYDATLLYSILNDTHGIDDVDMLNPSQIVNVRSDNINYFKHESIALQSGFIQKTWNVCPDLYARASLGYYEIAYAGGATELLWYPTGQPWAIGIEGGIFKKRNYRGLGFTSHLRKLHGFEPEFIPYTVLSQELFSIYYDWKWMCLDMGLHMGKFLANDWGGSLHFERYFDSGLRIGAWISYTSKKDRVNNDAHYADKGIMVSMPLDFFLTRHSRARWNYAIAAWLRDVGARAYTGYSLYPTLYHQRN